jgi:hypothetical protein
MRAQEATPDIDSMPASENLSAGSYESSPQLPVPIDTTAVDSADADSAAVDSATVVSTEELPPGQRTDAEKERRGVELSKRPVLFQARTYEDVLSRYLVRGFQSHCPRPIQLRQILRMNLCHAAYLPLLTRSMRARSKLLNIIALGYDEYKNGKTRWNTLNLLLDRLNRLMNTGYGFFGRLQDGPEGKPVCLVSGLARIAFDCHCARCCWRQQPGITVTIAARVIVRLHPHRS